VLDDLNAIASAASHEELAQAGELARERERAREKEAARSRNLTNGGTKATSKKEGKVSTLDETTPSPSPRAERTPYGSLTPRPSSALAGSYGSPGRLVRKANTPCFSGKKAEFLSSSPRVESDASRSRIDHAEIERRTLEALERERYESTRADAEREEALAKKRADLARIEEEVRASVERRRVEDREFSAAMVRLSLFSSCGQLD
jgi:septal ring factor EnvC (AmiA/AmiB activator)